MRPAHVNDVLEDAIFRSAFESFIVVIDAVSSLSYAWGVGLPDRLKI